MPNNLRAELEERFAAGTAEAIAAISDHPWLIIPDLNVNWLRNGYQGVYTNVGFGTGPRAELAMYFLLNGRLWLQWVKLASPSAKIREQGSLSAEFESAISTVRQWEDLADQRATIFHEQLDDPRVQYWFRIVIGQSQMQSDVEKMDLLIERRRNIRIRSYDWLLEKAERFTDEEIQVLDECGAGNEEDFMTACPKLLRMLDEPMPPYV